MYEFYSLVLLVSELSDEEETVATSLDENQSNESETGSPENTDDSDDKVSESESQSESDSSSEEEGNAAVGRNLFDGIDSDDEDDEDYVPKKQKQSKKQQPAEKQRIKSPEITQVQYKLDNSMFYSPKYGSTYP